jgi:hypothetical protein
MYSHNKEKESSFLDITICGLAELTSIINRRSNSAGGYPEKGDTKAIDPPGLDMYWSPSKL